MVTDALDESIKMSENAVLVSLKACCEIAIERFGEEYLRERMEEDLTRIMGTNAARGVPRFVVSIYFQHWK